MARVEVLQGDALDLIQAQSSSTIDLVVADPPYNLGKDYGNSHDTREFQEYIDFSRAWVSEAKRVLKPTGSIYIFMGVRFISYLYDILDRELDFFFNSWLCWHYTQGMGKTRGFSPRHDDILMFTKSTDFKFNLDSVRVPQKYYRARNNMRGANPGDVWTFSHVHYSHPNRYDHPTQKPEGLMERIILASSDADDWVLDPFSGTGTSLRVCQQLGRNCIGYELNPEFVQLTKGRLQKPFTGFDSIDSRMERIPNDLGDEQIREEYLSNHIQWFLRNHDSSIKKFNKAVEEKYNIKDSTRLQDATR